MSGKKVFLRESSPIFQELIRNLGLVVHHATTLNAVGEALSERHSEKELKGNGLIYDELGIVGDTGFEIAIEGIRKDAEIAKFWNQKVRRATIFVVRGGARRLDCDWHIEVDIGDDSNQLYVRFSVEISRSRKVSNCAISTLNDQDYNQPIWTAFLLKHQ